MAYITELCHNLEKEELLDHLTWWSWTRDEENALSAMEEVGTLRLLSDTIGVEELAAVVGCSGERMRAIFQSPEISDHLDPKELVRADKEAFTQRIETLRKRDQPMVIEGKFQKELVSGPIL